MTGVGGTSRLAALTDDTQLVLGLGRARKGRVRRVDAATAGVPWVLYGAGVSAETFAWQLRHAIRAGARGFLVGRTVWREALTAAEPSVAARDVCRPRFASFVTIACEAGRR